MYQYKWYDPIRIPVLCAPFYSIVRIAFVFFVRLLTVAQIRATALFIDNALGMLKKETDWTQLLFPVIVLALVIVIDHLEGIIVNILNQCIANRIRCTYMEFIIQKTAKLPCEELENPKTWDLIHRVKTKPDETLEKGFDNILNIVGFLVQMVGILVVLSSYIWWSFILVFLMTAGVMAMAMRGGEQQYDVQREVTESVRRYKYFGEILTGRDAADERNLFRFSDFFQRKWEKCYYDTRRAERKMIVKWLFRTKMMSSLMSVIMCGVAAVLLVPVSMGRITVGLYISLIQAVYSLVDIASWSLSDNVNGYAKYKEYIKDFILFYNLPERETSLNLPSEHVVKINTLEFVNVSFSYPGTEKRILKDVSFKMEAGKHYALVGGNGAGKTTLIKLMLGLYTDFEGEILINGTSIRCFDFTKIMAMFAVLFQDYSRYQVSLRDNIGLGNVRMMGTEEQERQIYEALELLGMKEKAEQFDKGIDMPLGKLDSEGRDLSGGEWQRVAMARTILSPASFLILDEPTAALDPVSESKLYEEFQKISRERTTIFISHRLGSTMLADEIVVLDQGSIIQQGAHDVLMEQCPLYREMYESQRSWYSNEG